MYTRVFPCAFAHREARWNWSEVVRMVNGYDPTVLSHELSRILSQTLSQISYNYDCSAKKKKTNKKNDNSNTKKKKMVALPRKSAHYLIWRNLALCQDSSRESTDELASAYDPEDEVDSDSDPKDRTKSKGCLRKVDTIPFCERWRYRKLEAIVFGERWHYRRVETIVDCEVTIIEEWKLS